MVTPTLTENQPSDIVQIFIVKFDLYSANCDLADICDIFFGEKVTNKVASKLLKIRYVIVVGVGIQE